MSATSDVQLFYVFQFQESFSMCNERARDRNRQAEEVGRRCFGREVRSAEAGRRLLVRRLPVRRLLVRRLLVRRPWSAELPQDLSLFSEDESDRALTPEAIKSRAK